MSGLLLSRNTEIQWNGGPIGTIPPRLDARSGTLAKTPQKQCPERPGIPPRLLADRLDQRVFCSGGPSIGSFAPPLFVPCGDRRDE
jgi:hypothetical protein